MEQQQHHERIPRRGAFWSALHSLKWPLFLLAWIVLWVPVMVVLFWWQVPLFISLPFLFLGMGLFVFIMVQYVRDSWLGQYIQAQIWPPRDEPKPRQEFLDKDVQYPL